MAQDDFNRADNADIGANWTAVTGSTALKIVSNQVQPSALASNAAEYWNADTFTDNQWTEVKVVSCVGAPAAAIAGPGVALRVATGANTYYRLLANNSNSDGITLSKVVAGTATILRRMAWTYAANKILRLEVEGNILRAFVDGVCLGGISDLSILTGNRAGVAYGTNASITSSILDNWSAGNLGSLWPIRSVNVGAKATANSGNVTLFAPSGSQTDDLWVASLWSNDNVAHGLTGWTSLITQTNSGTTGRISSWYFRYAGSTPNLVVTHSAGSLIVGGITCIRGAKKTGSPINVISPVITGSTANITIASITTTVAGCLILSAGGSNVSASPKMVGGPVVYLLEDTLDAGNPNGHYMHSLAGIGIYELYFSGVGSTGTNTFTTGTGPAAAFQCAIEPEPAPVSAMFRNRMGSRAGLNRHSSGVGSV